MTKQCPICKMPTYYFNQEAKGFDEIHCYRCGKFTIYRNLYDDINDLLYDKQKIAIISGWIRNNQIQKIKNNLYQLLNIELIGIEERADNLLLYIQDNYPSFGQIISYEIDKLPSLIDGFEKKNVKVLTDENIALAQQLLPLLAVSWSKNFEEIDFILYNYLGKQKKYIETVGRKQFIITPDGISYINSLKLEVSTVKQENDVDDFEGNMEHDPSELSNLKSIVVWKLIEDDYGVTKRQFAKNINFVKNPFKRSIIFRDVEHAYILASKGYSKPSVILAGSVIEELLRIFLDSKNIVVSNKTFDCYIQTCEHYGLLKKSISLLSDSVRHFRNLVHLSKEEEKKHTISKATAKGSVSSIFTISNDFE